MKVSISKVLLSGALVFIGLASHASVAFATENDHHTDEMTHQMHATSNHMEPMHTMDQQMHYKHEFHAELTGQKEVPPVDTMTKGMAHIHVSETEKMLHYSLSIENPETITAAHLHCAAEGQNGPVVAPLDHTKMSGSITNKDIMAANCPIHINTTEHIVQAMREGKIYVNVHSAEHPNGVVRGQVMLK